MSTEIARREAPGALEGIRDLEDRFALAVRQRELLEAYIRERLKPGKHFYRVAPGQKDSLTKEGAELVCLPHGYKPAYSQTAGPEQPPEDDTPYQITVLCRLMKADNFEGEGIGSASSHITKKTGERIVRMRDIGLRHNATLKVAQKSAYIAATLNATAASEFFTQDMEDATEVEAATPVAGTGKGDEFFCSQHQTQWFKKGRMKNYAHPIGDTGEWCNMPDKAKAILKRTKEALDDAISEGKEGPQDEQDVAASERDPGAAEGFPVTTIVELLNFGLSKGFKNKDAILAALEVKDTALIGDLQEATKKLAAQAKGIEL